MTKIESNADYEIDLVALFHIAKPRSG